MNLSTQITVILFGILLISCSESDYSHELVSTPSYIHDTIEYHDIDFYTPEYGEFPVLDSANDLMHDGFHSQAIAQYARAENVLGFHPDIYINRGHCFSKLKNYAKAIENNTALIEYDSVYYPAYMNRGMNYLDSGKYDFAILDFKSSISLVPERPEAYVNLGLTFVEMNVLDSACYYFKLADELDILNNYSQIDKHINNYCTSWEDLLEPPKN